jgi:hypothetical protein
VQKGHGLLQGWNWAQWLALGGQCPILHQLFLIQICPFKHGTQRTLGKFTANDAGFDFKDDFVVAVTRMKMWRRVVAQFM